MPIHRSFNSPLTRTWTRRTRCDLSLRPPDSSLCAVLNQQVVCGESWVRPSVPPNLLHTSPGKLLTYSAGGRGQQGNRGDGQQGWVRGESPRGPAGGCSKTQHCGIFSYIPQFLKLGMLRSLPPPDGPNRLCKSEIHPETKLCVCAVD